MGRKDSGRSMLNALTLSMLALYSRMLEAFGEYSVKYWLESAMTYKLPIEAFLNVGAWAASKGFNLNGHSFELATKLGVTGAPLTFRQRISLLCGRRIRFYASQYYGSYASDIETERLMRRLALSLESLPASEFDPTYGYGYLYLDGKVYSELWRKVSSFRKYPMLLKAALNFSSTMDYETCKQVKRAYRAAKARLKLSGSRERSFVSYVVEQAAYYPHAQNAKNIKEIFKAWKHYNGEHDEEEKTRNDWRMRQEDKRLAKAYFSKRTVASDVDSFASSYAKGFKLADIAMHTCEALACESRTEGKPIVVYGRDCEVFFHILREFYPDIRVSYVLAPRPLTTEFYGDDTTETRKAYKAYLRKHIPSDAIHFDSGFSGSIINWVRNRMVIPIHSVRLMSTSVAGYELFGAASRSERMRSIVLNDIEHEEHRLREANNGCWRAWEFADTVPAFWSRMSGMRDGVNAIRNGSRSLIPLNTLCGIKEGEEPEEPEPEACDCASCQPSDPDTCGECGASYCDCGSDESDDNGPTID